MKHKFVIGLILLLAMACAKPALYMEYRSINEGLWNKDQKIEFTFKPKDSLQTYNLYILIRNDERYAYSNLFLIVSMLSENGHGTTDTLEYEMTRPDGSWLGHGFLSVRENKLWYKKTFRFKDNSKVDIKVEQAMREKDQINGLRNLEGVTDVGLQIEKNKHVL